MKLILTLICFSFILISRAQPPQCEPPAWTFDHVFYNQLVPVSTTMTLNTGDPINVGLQLSAQPGYSSGSFYMQVLYELEYVLVDAISGTEFIIGIDDGLYNRGQNYTTFVGWLDGSTMSSVNIPHACHLEIICSK